MEKFPSLSRLAKFYGLDTHDRFLTCTGDSEKLCRAQTTMVIVPHCLKKYEASLPDVLSDQQAQAAAYNKKPRPYPDRGFLLSTQHPHLLHANIINPGAAIYST